MRIMEELTLSLEDIAALRVGSMTLGTLTAAAMAFLIGFILIHILTAMVHRAFFRHKEVGPTLGGVLESIIKIVLWVLTSLIIADILGIPIASIVAAVGVVGLALSLSVQNILSNLFSGITLLITKPFAAGHYVDIAGKTGSVVSMNLFYTVLLTRNNEQVNIPNSDVTSAAVINYSSQGVRRVEQLFTASYDAPTEAVRAAILQAAREEPLVLPDPAPVVSISSFGESSIEYNSRVWCESKDYWDVVFNMNERVRETFAAYGVEMTYNHLNVHLKHSGCGRES